MIWIILLAAYLGVGIWLFKPSFITWWGVVYEDGFCYMPVPWPFFLVAIAFWPIPCYISWSKKRRR